MPTTINGVVVQDQGDSTLTGSTDPLTGTTALTITRLGAYATGTGEGSGEVFAYDKATKRLFVMNNDTDMVEVVDITDPAAMVKVSEINVGSLAGYGGMNSVAVAGGILAVAVENSAAGTGGMLAFYSATTGGLLNTVTVGVLPDMLTFTPDGKKLVVANEGERAGILDPEGSISLIDLSAGVASATVQTTGFAALDGQEDALRALGVRITPGRPASTDIEPEYISLSADGKTAYVTLQEANSIGVFDISGTTPVLQSILPLGYVDHSLVGNESDFSDRDAVGSSAGAINLHNAPIRGMPMPDAIATFVIGGVTYFATANEGDARSDDSDVARLSGIDLNDGAFPDETALKNEDNAGRLNISTIDGDTNPGSGADAGLEQIHTFGGRGISLFKVNADGTIEKVDETGGEFQKIIAAQLPALFNTNQNNSAASFDTRSDDKGPEPEAVDVANVGGNFYAFVGLERQGGVMVYDVTDPTNATFTTYVPPFMQEDNGPEIVQYIDPVDSPNGKGLLLTANEISGSVTAYQVVPQTYTLQLLHMSDGEAGLLADDTAPIMGALIDRFEDQFANTVVLAGGDNYIPGPFLNAGTDPSLNAIIGATAPGRPDIAIYNAFGVEASVIGNHEFDLGSTVFRDTFTPAGAWVGAQFPYLSANLDFTGDSALNPRATAGGQEASSIRGRLAPSAVITEGGERIGIVGVTTQLLEIISSPNGTEVKGFPTAGQPGDNEEFEDFDLLAAQLQPVIDDLIAQGVNKVILTTQLQQLENEQLLATLLTGVDIILAAGSNTRLGDADDVAATFPGHEATFEGPYPIVTEGLDGKPLLIVNTDGEFTYLGRLVVEFDENGEIIVDRLDDFVPINGAYASTQENLEAAYGADIDQAFAEGSRGDRVRDITEAVDAVIAAKDGTLFGFTDVYLEGERAFVRNEETNLGDLSADANTFAAREALGDGPFIVSLKNGGGIRAPIGAVDSATGDKIPPLANPDVGKPAGAVSQLDVENALRFNNRLMVFDTTPQGLLNILNWGAGLSANNGGFPQIGGVSFSFNPDLPGNSGSTPGSRIRDVALVDADGNILALLVDDGVVLPDAPPVISVVTLNFTAQGGDGYPVKANADNFRFLLDDGTLSGPVDEALDFTAPVNVPPNALGEQQAFTDFLQEFHATPETAYDRADTPIAEDTRIQNLNFRDDTVFDSAPIVGDGGDNTLVGTPGNDTIDGGGGDDEIDGGGGNDTIDGGDGDDEIDGGVGNDTIAGGNGDDTMHGGNGDDTFIVGDAAGGLALLSGFSFGGQHGRGDRGDGRDLYDGDAGIDTLDFSNLNKEIELDLKDGTTRFGSDTTKDIENVTGTGKSDELSGNSNANVLRGNGGNDELDGEGGDDQVFGDDGNDEIDGGSGNDLLFGGNGKDELEGSHGNDRLDGGDANDELDGGHGNDVLIGGLGNDKLEGGSGSDHFVFRSLDEGVDWIEDLKTKGSDQDQIVFLDSMFEGFSGDDGLDLVAGGFLRAQGASGGRTNVQVDIDGGGDEFVTIAIIDDRITTGTVAQHTSLVDFIV
jgi:2',3'-cyclic-nucleotide 2'-phosphodiesterase (5'-nucleotidase family)